VKKTGSKILQRSNRSWKRCVQSIITSPVRNSLDFSQLSSHQPKIKPRVKKRSTSREKRALNSSLW